MPLPCAISLKSFSSSSSSGPSPTAEPKQEQGMKRRETDRSPTSDPKAPGLASFIDLNVGFDSFGAGGGIPLIATSKPVQSKEQNTKHPAALLENAKLLQWLLSL